MYDWKELFNHMPARYTRENSPEDIATHIELHQKLAHATALVQISPADDDRSRMITICCKDQPGLFTKITGAFFLHEMDIQEARIYTWTNKTAIDIFKVKLPIDALLDDTWSQRLKKDLMGALENRNHLEAILERKMASPDAAPDARYHATPSVRLDNDASRFFTVISVSAGDGLGLLYRIARALHRSDVSVCTARIATFGYLVMDVFFIQGRDGQKILERARLQEIQDSLMAVLDQPRS
ncbi:MAG: hypothetical protein JEZ02_00460 [Desulfatibacillum sp.]|nr:hypothetical protein [Desulfatibacillum sp.]